MNVNIQSISLNGDAGYLRTVNSYCTKHTILKKLIDNIKKIDIIDKVTRSLKN
jgi:GTP pyrophosphokinase